MAVIDVLIPHETGDRGVNAQIHLHALSGGADLEPGGRDGAGKARQRELHGGALGLGRWCDAGWQRSHEDPVLPDLSQGPRGRERIERHQRRESS